MRAVLSVALLFPLIGYAQGTPSNADMLKVCSIAAESATATAAAFDQGKGEKALEMLSKTPGLKAWVVEVLPEVLKLNYAENRRKYAMNICLRHAREGVF